MQVGVDEAGGVIRVSDRKVAEPTEVTTAASAIGRPFGVHTPQDRRPTRSRLTCGERTATRKSLSPQTDRSRLGEPQT